MRAAHACMCARGASTYVHAHTYMLAQAHEQTKHDTHSHTHSMTHSRRMAHEHGTRHTETHVTHIQTEHDTRHTQTEHGKCTNIEKDTKHKTQRYTRGITPADTPHSKPRNLSPKPEIRMPTADFRTPKLKSKPSKPQTLNRDAYRRHAAIRLRRSLGIARPDIRQGANAIPAIRFAVQRRV